MIKPILDESEPTPEVHAGADAATAARRLRLLPPQAAPGRGVAGTDPREDMCIDECLGGIRGRVEDCKCLCCTGGCFCACI